jgi:hypothetical protein
MANQNILKFYGSKLDLKVDYSELYDFELSKVTDDYNEDVLDFNTEITYSGLTVDSSCLTDVLDDIKPWVYEINDNYTGGTCDFTVRRRTEKGWTLDFVLNKENIAWSGGTTFYYWGISGETEQRYYADNNLSFSFTNDGRIKWEKYHYSGVCHTVSGYTESYYTLSGQTPVLCNGGTSSDFNVTIVFTRNNELINCEVENEGGWNDLILGPHAVSYSARTGSTSTQIATGYTITNTLDSWISGGTITNEYIEELNKKWWDSRLNRLGTLKIYLNGKPIYTLKNWEEVVPSLRNSTNPIIQSWGGGTDGYNSIHTGTTEFTILQIKYFEEPLDFVHVKHHYKSTIYPNYNINECGVPYINQIVAFDSNALLNENGEYLFTEDNNILIY